MTPVMARRYSALYVEWVNGNKEISSSKAGDVYFPVHSRIFHLLFYERRYQQSNVYFFDGFIQI
jgi:hypothetical protein